MKKHSPAPWSIHGDTIRANADGIASDQADVCYINREAGSPQSEWFGDQNVAESNANLIAAAPELLDALIEMTSTRMDVVGPYKMLEVMNRAFSAIAKARGEK